MSRSEWPALFIPSYERPQVSAPSPTMATTLWLSPLRSRAVAMPSAADMAVPAWPAPNWSCSLSLRLRKPEIPSLLPERRETVVAAGEQLPGVGLVADVPDDLVARRVELIEQRDAELHDAEAGADVAAGDRAALDEAVADLLGELGELVAAEALQVGGGLDGGEGVIGDSVDGSIWRRPDTHPAVTLSGAKGPCVEACPFAEFRWAQPGLRVTRGGQYGSARRLSLGVPAHNIPRQRPECPRRHPRPAEVLDRPSGQGFGLRRAPSTPSRPT